MSDPKRFHALGLTWFGVMDHCFDSAKRTIAWLTERARGHAVDQKNSSLWEANFCLTNELNEPAGLFKKCLISRCFFAVSVFFSNVAVVSDRSERWPERPERTINQNDQCAECVYPQQHRRESLAECEAQLSKEQPLLTELTCPSPRWSIH